MKVNDIRKQLLKVGLDVTGDQIRAYEKKGLFKSTRSDTGYRMYDKSQINDIVTSIMLCKVGYGVNDIIENKSNLLKLLNKTVKKLL